MQRTQTKKISKKKTIAKTEAESKQEHFFEAVGRRKTSTARIRISLNKAGEIFVNNKPLKNYFPTLDLQQTVYAPLKITDFLDKFQVSARVKGGGFVSQAEAVRHGIARALVLFNSELRKVLKKAGFLTRDPRMRERKKFGLKRARRARQWRKR